jgi:hypothetical protein
VPAINFPDSPTSGQVFTAANKSWTYDGSKWIITQYDNGLDSDVTDYIDQEIASANQTARGYAIVFGFLS